MSSPSSFLSRALPASIFVVISLVCLYLMDIISLIRDFPPPAATGYFEWSGGKVAILESFHWGLFRPLDVVFRDVTVGFAPSSYGTDDVSRWQMLNFLTDPGVFYAIWGFESLRGGLQGGPIYYPGTFYFLAQLGGGGVLIPLYYFAHLVWTRPLLSQTQAERKVNLNGSMIWVLLVVVFDRIPYAGMMFDTTFEARHWWTWLWQLFSSRMTITWYAIQFLAKLIPFSGTRTTNYQTKISLILSPLIAISAGMWIYTLLYCPHSLWEVFFPQPLIQDSWTLRIRRILQFDQLFVYGSEVLWIAMDIRRNGVSMVLPIIVVGVVLAGTVGTGASFGLLWLWREWQLVSKRDTAQRKIQ